MDDNLPIEKINLDKVDWRGSREFFESLGEALDKLDDKDEAYDFTWVGKRKSIIEAGAPINKTFRPDVDASKNWDVTENLFIEGDNLDALKLLQESYLGKVKMIYVDPPYNTGKDFVYHDNFKADVEEYDEATEYKDESGNIQFKKNEKTNGRYHSDWLSMMYPRLKLARNLLANDGVIFISIGEDEISNLKNLCIEIFGEDNYLATISRYTKKGSSNGEYFSPSIDYILSIARRRDLLKGFSAPLSDEYRSKYTLSDNKGKYVLKGLYQASLTLERSSNARYYISTPGGEKCIPPTGKRWRVVEETYKQLLDADRIVFKQTANSPLINDSEGQSKWNIYTKQYLHEIEEKGLVPPDYIDNILNALGTKDIKELGLPFDFPKPVKLIQYLAQISGTKSVDIILDFFCGSGTTAHAVMQLNADDGGSRKWIMVQLPEETDEKSEAYKAGYKTIPEISKERIRRAGDKIAAKHPEAKVDYGFRALTISDTNYKDVYKSAGQYEQSKLLDDIDNIKEGLSDLDLLFGVLTQFASELNKPIETRDISGSKVYLYDYFGEASGVAACFSDKVSDDTIKAVARLNPDTAVFRDSTFEDSQAKINLAEHFRILSPNTKIKVI
jgi:adenine-specific DNA-methyltransferase